MDSLRTRKGEPVNSNSIFTQSEIMEMEHLFKCIEHQLLTKQFFEDLATSFSCTPLCTGRAEITWEQVKSWFHDKQKELETKSTSALETLKLFVDLTESNGPNNTFETSRKPKGNDVTGLSELMFEAKSSKDDAWYDVAQFLSYRIVSSGKLEVRVRYSGYGREEDEWVNVTHRVRERSIPLEASECQKLKIGDEVLCFQERVDQAVYCDARVVDIHRGIHDITGCKCIFVVRFDHDNSEEQVQLWRICIRPSQSSSFVFKRGSATVDTERALFRNKDMKFSFLY